MVSSLLKRQEGTSEEPPSPPQNALKPEDANGQDWTDSLALWQFTPLSFAGSHKGHEKPVLSKGLQLG